jgi:hypothetical protein
MQLQKSNATKVDKVFSGSIRVGSQDFIVKPLVKCNAGNWWAAVRNRNGLVNWPAGTRRTV